VCGRWDARNQKLYSIAGDSIYDLCRQVCGTLEKRLAKQARVIGGARVG
jgi:hypothetical protein